MDDLKLSYAQNDSGDIVGPITEEKYKQNDGTMVTVVCITYKHEEFIAQALESFLMQKTNFKFKVFVGEDCGPDNTAQIVKEYAEKYPDIIVPFIREKNMGAQRNLIDLCQRANSPYIAFCEGDDYWIDEYKLQKQFDFMESNKEYRICFSKCEIKSPEDWFLRSWFKADKEGKLIFPDCEPNFKSKKEIFDMYDFVWVFPAQTATVFYRWNYDLNIPDWYFEGIIGDWPIFLMQLGIGKAYFIKDIMSVYRRSDVGVFMSSNMDEHFLKTRLDHLRWMQGILEYYDDNSFEKYPKIPFENRIKVEVRNYLTIAYKQNDNSLIEKLVVDYPVAAKIAINAYISFYNDAKNLEHTIGWDGYKLVVRNRHSRKLLKPYSIVLKICKTIKRNLLKAKDLIKSVIKNICLFICYWGASFIPKRNNLWIITSFRETGYLDNSKYYYEYLCYEHPEIDAVWITKDEIVYNQLKEMGMPVKKAYSIDSFFMVARARIAIIDHFRVTDLSALNGFNDNTKVVQLWHGVGFKAMGDKIKVKNTAEKGMQYSYDLLLEKEDSFFVKMQKKLKYFFCAYDRELFERYFMIVCPGQERVDMVAKMWNIPEGNIFMSGHPRNKMLYKTGKSLKPFILYAPTYRFNAAKEKRIVDELLSNIDIIQDKMKEIDGKFVIRLHPHTWRNYKSIITKKIEAFSNIVFDEGKDIYSDFGKYWIVITDYSSIAMDHVMLNKPVIFHCPDLKWFIENEAGFNLDFEKMTPGPKTYTWDETLLEIEKYIVNPQKDSEWREEICEYFFDKSVNDENNSERITQEIKRRLKM